LKVIPPVPTEFSHGFRSGSETIFILRESRSLAAQFDLALGGRRQLVAGEDEFAADGQSWLGAEHREPDLFGGL